MEEAIWHFDAELCLLRDEKMRLDVQMKLADLRYITLFQELLLLKEFERRENTLQERLSARMQEERELRVRDRRMCACPETEKNKDNLQK